MRSAATVREPTSALPGRTWKGRIRELSPVADPATRTYTARVSLIEVDPGFELGMSARVAFPLRDTAARIELPLAALYSRGEQPQVFVLDKSGAVQLRAVKTGGFAEDGVVIESGLASGERVVAAGAQLLRPGQKVRVLAEKTPAATAPTARTGN